MGEVYVRQGEGRQVMGGRCGREERMTVGMGRMTWVLVLHIYPGRLCVV